jgi:hypothetical protein
MCGYLCLTLNSAWLTCGQTVLSADPADLPVFSAITVQTRAASDDSAARHLS